jgi:hypothetical protein
MAGLVWKALGKAVADSGSMYAQMGMQDYQARQAEERALRSEERAEERAIRGEERKDARIEAAAQKDAKIYADAEQAAPGIGEQRRFDKFKSDLGQTDMPEEDVRKVFESQYDQRKVGDFEGADRYVEKYSRQKEDVLNEIRRAGGSSAAIKEARESYRATVDAERAFEKEAIDRRREDRKDALAAQTANYQTGMVSAAMARAERPTAGASGADIDSKITRAEQALSSARSRIEKGFREPSMQEKLDPVGMDAYTKERNTYVDSHPDVKRQTERLERMYSGDSDNAPAAPAKPKPGDNQKIVGDSPHPEGTRLKGPGGTYVVRNGKPVLEK